MGRTVDVAKETDESQEQDGTDFDLLPSPLGRRRRVMSRQGPVTVPVPLPGDCLGAACYARAAMEALIAKCGDNSKCWEEVLVGLKAGGSTGQAPGTYSGG